MTIKVFLSSFILFASFTALIAETKSTNPRQQLPEVEDHFDNQPGVRRWSPRTQRSENTASSVYGVAVRSENSTVLLDQNDQYLRLHPYAVFQPPPFYDLGDAGANGPRPNTPSFLIAGINCDQTIEGMRTLTGISMDVLNRRLQGVPGVSQQSGEGGPDWQGISNWSMRKSSGGFLTPAQNLRQQLLNDNRLIRQRNLTHQQVAEPILAGINAYRRACLSAPVTELNHEVRFTYSGTEYTFRLRPMGGEIRLRGLRPTAEELRQSCLERVGGWTGAGVQGSPFHDELFASGTFTIHGPNGELRGDNLTPHLIYRYGFYQGGQYRMDPEAIIRFFGIRNPAGADPWVNCR